MTYKVDPAPDVTIRNASLKWEAMISRTKNPRKRTNAPEKRSREPNFWTPTIRRNFQNRTALSLKAIQQFLL
jgi:hypothetical protein